MTSREPEDAPERDAEDWPTVPLNWWDRNNPNLSMIAWGVGGVVGGAIGLAYGMYFLGPVLLAAAAFSFILAWRKREPIDVDRYNRPQG